MSFTTRTSLGPARWIPIGAALFALLALLLNTKMRTSLTIALCGLSWGTVAVNAAAAPLNITAFTSRDGYSLFECWQLASVPVEARAAINYDVGNTSSAEWSIIEPRTTVGEAWAPAAQITVVLNGLIRASVPPPSCTEAACPPASVGYFMPGTLASSVVIALDTEETSHKHGHFTEFPSDEHTVLLQTTFANGVVPEHTVLYDGPCKE